MAKLYFRYGAMGSSKTANALMVEYNYFERGKKALLVKPKLIPETETIKSAPEWGWRRTEFIWNIWWKWGMKSSGNMIVLS